MDTHMDINQLRAEYFKKCFFTVDGLWFMKLEEDTSFEKSLEIDIAVWKILPKIQARTIKKLLGLPDSVLGLQMALAFKLTAEGFKFGVRSADQHSVSLDIEECPWVQLMANAGRQHLALAIADAICPVEHATFAQEFDPNIRFNLERKGCLEPHSCIFSFNCSVPQT
jgi:hypothetical protein